MTNYQREGKTSRESWNQTGNEAELKVVIDLSVSEYFNWIEYWDFFSTQGELWGGLWSKIKRGRYDYSLGFLLLQIRASLTNETILVSYDIVSSS